MGSLVISTTKNMNHKCWKISRGKSRSIWMQRTHNGNAQSLYASSNHSNEALHLHKSFIFTYCSSMFSQKKRKTLPSYVCLPSLLAQAYQVSSSSEFLRAAIVCHTKSWCALNQPDTGSKQKRWNVNDDETGQNKGCIIDYKNGVKTWLSCFMTLSLGKSCNVHNSIS